MMLDNENELMDDRDDHAQLQQNKPVASRVDDENVEEKDLHRSFLFGDAQTKPVKEGMPMGGESFGENNVTPSGDDKNNPSQNAGYSNAYFRRTEPSENILKIATLKCRIRKEDLITVKLKRKTKVANKAMATNHSSNRKPNKKVQLITTVIKTVSPTYPVPMNYPISKRLVKTMATMKNTMWKHKIAVF
jgi:hypothetical protein